jgi:hypothetical protein
MSFLCMYNIYIMYQIRMNNEKAVRKKERKRNPILPGPFKLVS